ncbi:MAG: coenzyme F420 hydrogenase subunit beta [Candidatus Methanofastidiosa archaeon]|nr:coenzyme F420 hydrogenase subunit beta [Candidatus Methanofastidiosa archaeon]
MSIYTVRASNLEILKNAQSGGTTTALLHYCLDSRLIDGILTGGKDKEKYWLARSALVTNYDELIETTGTTYNLCPTLNILKEAATSNYLKNIAIVGLPCVNQAIRKLEVYPLSMRSVVDKISLRIGLFCTHNFRYNAMIKMMEELGEIRAEDTYKVDIGAGNYVIYSVSGDIQKIPIDVVREYEQESCSICPDFTAELSDISIGSIGAPEGWNTVIVRTKTGQKFFEAAVQNGYLEVGKEGKVDIELVKKLSKIKKNRSKKKIENRKKYNLKVPF